MQELRAQIQAQLKLADTLKKISEAAGGKWQYFRREKTILFFLLVNFCSKLIVIALEIDSNYAIREKIFSNDQFVNELKNDLPFFYRFTGLHTFHH